MQFCSVNVALHTLLTRVSYAATRLALWFFFAFIHTMRQKLPPVLPRQRVHYLYDVSDVGVGLGTARVVNDMSSDVKVHKRPLAVWNVVRRIAVLPYLMSHVKPVARCLRYPRSLFFRECSTFRHVWLGSLTVTGRTCNPEVT